MAQPENEDIRMSHINISAQQVLAVDSNEWKEMMRKEENQTLIKDFLDTPTTNILLIYLDITREWKLSLEVMNNKLPLPKRSCFFLKNRKTVSMDNYKQVIVFGNLSDFPLKQYQGLFGKVLKQIFCNPSSNQRWPFEVGLNIASHFLDFQTVLSYDVGLAEQKTVLMIPETAKLIENLNVDEITQSDSYNQEIQGILNSITEMLSNWIPIVKEVLESNTEHILSQVDQGPTTEISFWKERKDNLEFIYAQVDSPLVKKMVLALEKTNNTHLSNFKKLLQDIAEGLDEAREVCGNFTEMSTDLVEISGCSLHKLEYFLREALITITSSWIQSKYYKSIPSRIIVLVKKICYILYEKAHKFLDPMSLFTRRKGEVTKDVKLSLDVMYLFLKSYNDCREKFQSSDEKIEIYPWIFPDERVFTQFRIFIQRLEEILDVLLVAELYCNIPIKKLFKMQQVEYRRSLEEIQSKFTQAYETFEKCTYDPLDLKSMEFPEDYKYFSKKIQELDIKFGITVGHVCLSCTPVEDTYEIINIFQPMIKRPLANHEFQNLVSSHLLNISMEFCNVKENHDDLMRHLDKSDELFVYKNLPVIAGAMQWSLDLQKKMELITESVGEVSEHFENTDDYDNIIANHQEIQYLLNKFEEHIAFKWKLMLDSFHAKIDQELFKTDDKNNVCLNFHSQISEVAQEIKYLKEIKKDKYLPEEAKKFNEISENVLLARSLLACSIRWYNHLNENLLDIERNLLSEDWSNITSLIEKGHSKKWTSNDVLTYAEELYYVTKSVYESINQAKKNVSAVHAFIKTWKSVPMFTREQPDSYLDFEVQSPKVQDQISAVKRTSEDMKNVLEKNKELFKSDASSEEWKSYTSYLDSIIENGIKEAIKCSLEYLQQNTDPSNTKLAPFYEVHMWLDKDVVFTPPLQPNQPRSVCKLLDTVLYKIYSLAKAGKRLTDANSDYYDAIDHCEELNTLKDSIKNNVLSGCNKALLASEIFSMYSDLWLKNVEEDLADFVEHGPMQDTLVEDEEGNVEEIQVESKPPTEEDFKLQIAQFDKLHRKIDDIPQLFRVESWLILNVDSFKGSLLSIIKKWSLAYKNKLIELKSLGSLRKLEEDDD